VLISLVCALPLARTAVAATANDLVCYRVDDPLAISGTIVTSSADLGVSPPCRIDAAATRLCVSATAPAIDASDAQEDASAQPTPSESGGQSAQLCYVVVCPDDVPPPEGAVADAFGEHALKGMQASSLCVPATLGATNAAAEQNSNRDRPGGASANAEAPSLIDKDQGCGDANGDGTISASDALAALRTAVGINSGCGSCACDVNNSASITASDALTILRVSVGQALTLGCPEGPFSVVWDGGGDGTSWQDRLNWAGDGIPRFCDSVTIDIPAEASVAYASQTLSILSLTSAEDLTVNTGSLTLRQASSVTGKFTLNGGTFTVDDTLSLADFDWTGGNITNAGTTTVTGAITISNPGGKGINGGTLKNAGTTAWSEGTVFITNGSVIENPVGATFEITGDIDLHYAGGTFPSFINAGTLLKSGGTGTSQWSAPTTSTGTIDLRAGTWRPSLGVDVSGPVTISAPGAMQIDTATNVFNPSSTVSGTGSVILAGGTNTFSGTYTIASAMSVSGGTNKFDGPALTLGDLNLSGGTVEFDTPVEVTTAFNWTGGTLQGDDTTTVSGALTINNPGGKSFNGGTLTHTGPVTWSEGTLFVTNGATIDNPAGTTFEITGDIDLHYAGGTFPSFINAGTLLKSGGTGTSQWSAPTTSTGTIDLRTGTWRPSLNVTASGPVTITSPAVLQLDTATNVFDVSSTVSGTGGVTLAGGTNTFSGTYTIASAMNVSGGTNKFDGPALTIGDLNLSGGTVEFDTPVEVTTAFNWTGGTLQGDDTTTVSGALTINNPGGKSFNGGTLTHTGPVAWSEGTLFVTNGATIDNPAGTTFEITGDIDLHYAGGTFPSFVNAGTLLKSAGSGTSQWSAPTTSTGTIDLRAGTWRPSLNVTASGPVTITSPAALQLDTATNVFDATSAVSGTGSVALAGGANTFSGAYTLTSAMNVSGGTNKFDGPALTIGDLNLSGGTVEFDTPVEVTDAFNWTGGTLTGDDTTTVSGALAISNPGGKSFNGGTLTHTGLVTWSEGTLFITNGAVFDNPAGATFTITGDVDLHYAGGTFPSFVNAGTLLKSGGAGTTQWSVPTTNSGEVDLRTGLLNCSNGYTQTSAGTLTTAVGGTDPSLIGRLQTSTATLDGELALDAQPSYAPQLGDSFSVLSYGSRSGTFAAISGTSLGNGLTAQETYGATELSFEVQ
jgi:hypothetical protein